MAGRRQLWEDITDFKGHFVIGPWLVVGDFNAILGAHERKGGAPVCRRPCEEFQAMSDVCELVHGFMLILKGLNSLGLGEMVYVGMLSCVWIGALSIWNGWMPGIILIVVLCLEFVLIIIHCLCVSPRLLGAIMVYFDFVKCG